MINKANIILTHNCNLKCKHCYIDAKNCKENMEKNYITAKNIIKQLSKDNIKNIMFTGGECMIFPYLKDLIIYAKEFGMKVTIFTNGMIFDKEIIDLVDYVNISLDGSKKTHNYIRQNDNSYKNIIKLLDYLKQVDKYTTLQYTINNLNINDIDSLSELTLNYLNIRTVRLVFVSNMGRAKENQLYYTNNDLEYVFNKLDDLYYQTKYHIQFVPNIVNKYDFENYYLSGDLSFPLWFDIPTNKYYVLSEEIMNNESIDNYNVETANNKSNELIELLNRNKDKIVKQKYVDIDDTIIKIIKGEL